jgi:hypothetical protein
MSSRQAGGMNVDSDRSIMEYALDNTCELTKCLVREMFHFSSQVIDGVSASLLHIASDSRRVHHHPQVNKERKALHLEADRYIMNDKLLEIYVNKLLLPQTDSMEKIRLFKPNHENEL